jgi:hypothetical protein
MFSFNRLPRTDGREETGLVVFSHEGWLNSANGEATAVSDKVLGGTPGQD